MLSTPIISVVIPVYNVEHYLEHCLNSVIDQTYSNFEVICVNDGSMDNSFAILTRYAAKDHRVRILVQENQGASVARNNGVRHAMGKYVYFCDSDDCIHPQLLEIALFFAERNQAELVSFAFVPNVQHEQQQSRQYSSFDAIPMKTTTAPLYFCKKKVIGKLMATRRVSFIIVILLLITPSQAIPLLKTILILLH